MTITFALLIAGLSQAKKASSAGTLTSPRLKRLVTLPLLLIAAIALTVPRLRHVSPQDIKPYHPEARIITAGIWTVHFSLDQDMWDSTRRMSSLMKDMQLDVIGLLETDLHRSVFGNRDLTQYLAESLSMYADIGPGPDKHTWGAVLLSKFPIINSTHHLLPSPNGELAPAIHAVLDIYGIHTNIIVSHNGQEEDPYDRYLQTKKIAEIASSTYPQPFIFLGYVVTRPHATRPNPYQILFEDGRLHDVDPADSDRWCQYIGFRSLERIAYVRVSRYTVTDTEMQTVKFRIPKIGDPPIDPDRDVLPHRGSTKPDEDWAYPTKFIDPAAMVYR